MDKKLGLLILVALTFFACEDQIGEISLPPENNLGIFFVETSLEDDINQVWAGSSSSSFAGRILTGQYTDPLFGDIDATAYCDISIGFASYDPSKIETAEFKSLEFTLRIIDIIGTYNPNDLQILELYKLSEPVQNESQLTSSSTIPFGEKIGEAEFNLYPDSLNLEYTAGADSSLYDSFGNYNYKTRFNLTEQYKTEFFQGFIDAVVKGSVIDSAYLERDISYYLDQNLKGFAIVGKDANNAIITYSINVDNTKFSNFVLKYSVENINGERIDASANFIPNKLKTFNNISPNENTKWSNSVFDDVTNINTPFKTNDDLVYFQAGTNMLIDIDLSKFRNFRDTLNNVIIQKAELIIKDPLNEESNSNLPANLGFFLSSPDSIASGSLNNFNNKSSTPIEPPLTAVYNSTENEYRISIPIYLQSIINNDSNYDNLIIDANLIVDNNQIKYLVNLRDTYIRKFTVKKSNVILRYYYTITDKNK